MTFDHFSRHYK